MDELRLSTALDHLDPYAPLDDLEPLRDIVGSARVVAIGENSHYIREFALLRHRVLRFLVERCGFTVYAFESGFSEGFAVDAWMRGEGSPDDVGALAETSIPCGTARLSEVRDALRWLRYRGGRFAGIDVPEAAGSLLPSLRPLSAYLAEADPDALPLLDAALATAERIATTSMALAAPAWARLDAAEQDALTVALARLHHRFRAMRPSYVARGGRRAYDVARWRLQGACDTDYHVRAMAGSGLAGDGSAREAYMAGSVRWHLDHAEPSDRFVLAAHNAHIQKTPVHFEGRLAALPMGHHLDGMLGDGYVALGVTSGAGRTAALHNDESAPFGFRVDDTALAPPEDGSVEALLAGTGLSLNDLRRVPDVGPRPDRIRLDSGYIRTPVLEAFDAVFHVPESSVSEETGL